MKARAVLFDALTIKKTKILVACLTIVLLIQYDHCEQSRNVCSLKMAFFFL